MRKIHRRIRICCLLVLFLPVVHSAFAQSSQKLVRHLTTSLLPDGGMKTVTTTPQLPQVAWMLNWNPQTMAWDSSNRITYTYDNQGRTTGKLTELYVGTSWFTTLRETWTFTVGPRDTTRYLVENWSGLQWDPQSQIIDAYDVHGNLVFDIKLDYDLGNSAWDTISMCRFTYGYNSDNNVVSFLFEHFDTLSSSWQNLIQTFLSYTAAKEPDTILSQQWFSGAWFNALRSLDYTWFDYGDNLQIASREQLFNGTVWEDSRRRNCTYGVHRSQTCAFENWVLGAWENSNRTTINYDFEDQVTLNQLELFQSGQWNISSSDSFAHVYNGGNQLTETTELIWDISDQQYHPFRKWAYAQFFVDAEEAVTPALDVDVFPNPFENQLQLRFRDLDALPVEVTLQDMHGRPVYMQSLRGAMLNGTVRLVLPDLASGSYFLTLWQGEKRLTRKLLR